MDEPNANDENAIIADDDLNEVPEEEELPTDGFLLSGTASLLSIEDYRAFLIIHIQQQINGEMWLGLIPAMSLQLLTGREKHCGIKHK